MTTINQHAMRKVDHARPIKRRKPRSVEHDAAIRAGNFGRPLTEAEIRQRSLAVKGKPKNEESIRKRSETIRRLNRMWFDNVFIRLAAAKAKRGPTPP